MSSTVFEWKPTFDPLAFARQTSLRSAQPPLTLSQIHSAIEEAASRPLNRATTLPAQAYTSEDLFSWEIKHLLREGWQCIGHISQIPTPGDFINIDLLGEPLIIVHAKGGQIRVMSRVCPHRAMDIMPAGFGYDGHAATPAPGGIPACGHTSLFKCPYHAWTFDLEGRLKGCPEMQEAVEFSKGDFALKSFRSEMWLGFLFVNLDGGAPPLAEGLAEMAADLQAFELDKMKLVISREWDCPFNWKVLVENFMESYHHLGIHHSSLQPMMPARETWTEKERRHYVRAHLPYNEATRMTSRASEVSEDWTSSLPPLARLGAQQKEEWGLYLVHPTFLLATAPDRVIWYCLKPIGPDRLKLVTTTLLAADAMELPNFEKLRLHAAEQLTAFHLEDMEVCAAVQRGYYATGWQPGRLSHLEMPIWLFHRYIAARIRGEWPCDSYTPAPGQR